MFWELCEQFAEQNLLGDKKVLCGDFDTELNEKHPSFKYTATPDIYFYHSNMNVMTSF